LIIDLITALTLCVDSYFWDKPFMWPEFARVSFNVYHRQTSPPLLYFTTHLPKLLTVWLPFSILRYTIDKQIRLLLLPSITFMVLMSFLPYKEWSFMIYVVLMFSLGAARSEVWMYVPFITSIHLFCSK
ncbi:hypothetical protein L208DRAFT_1304408, partial [Tricholoma matsutake]